MRANIAEWPCQFAYYSLAEEKHVRMPQTNLKKAPHALIPSNPLEGGKGATKLACHTPLQALITRRDWCIYLSLVKTANCGPETKF